eukprot:CAMPEP_0182424456 /NCGR_PEP_ID=MMETSP1167-20130531/10667_1 /TAXON_ID=2988 /ORGANISM="Mallomonas Sp, Strain CCMP3275" /LENGTH=263 /DNA_ID=CAMNT_0024604287 /DNA_START=162 /DNA_END=954 /DNA_ORIENTATION=+
MRWKKQANITAEKKSKAFDIRRFVTGHFHGYKSRKKFRRQLHCTYEKVWDTEHARLFWYNHQTQESSWTEPHLIHRYGDVESPSPCIPVQHTSEETAEGPAQGVIEGQPQDHQTVSADDQGAAGALVTTDNDNNETPAALVMVDRTGETESAVMVEGTGETSSKTETIVPSSDALVSDGQQTMSPNDASSSEIVIVTGMFKPEDRCRESLMVFCYVMLVDTILLSGSVWSAKSITAFHAIVSPMGLRYSFYRKQNRKEVKSMI